MNWLLQLDGSVFHFINNSLQNPVFDYIMPKITYLGSGGTVWILIIFLLAVFGKGTGRKIAFLGVVAFVLSAGSEMALKELFARPRPFVHFADARLLVPRLSDFSFPSGHVTTSFAPSVVFWRKHKQLGYPALVLAALIAFSRIYVGVHYPLDVLGGILLGAVVGWMVVSNETLLDKLAVRAKVILRRNKQQNT